MTDRIDPEGGTPGRQMEVVHLGAKRADKSGDSRDWTPAEALRETLQQVEAGKLKPELLYIAMMEPQPDGKVDFVYKAAGGRKIEYLGLLARHLHITNDSL